MVKINENYVLAGTITGPKYSRPHLKQGPLFELITYQRHLHDRLRHWPKPSWHTRN